MLRFIPGIFFILHAIVHGLYFGQGWRLFELQPGLIWPANSWAFKSLLGAETTRLLGSIFCLVSGIGFAVGGFAILFRQVWWRQVVLVAAVISSLVYLLFWDGKFQRLDQQGGIGLLINLVIIVAILVF